MSGESGERSDQRRRRRHLTTDEHKLWGGVIRSVAPLKRKPSKARALEAKPVPAEHAAPPPARRRTEPARHPAPKPAPKPANKPPLPVVGLERREKQRLVRGTQGIDLRIDLHGKTQSEAHAALLGFLRRAQAEGARFVLVITGKGGGPGASGERGILKRQVPHWLRLPEFRLLVLAIEDAHVTHGGKGALYVRMRRPRDQIKE
jgi:DNA-nicking Smr family endonuclease